MLHACCFASVRTAEQIYLSRAVNLPKTWLAARKRDVVIAHESADCLVVVQAWW